MLINLSNHPSALWTKEQVDEANALFGHVVDIEFPLINPIWEVDEVRALAVKMADQVRKRLQGATDSVNAVHIMGEMTFCFTLIQLLQQTGITCVASTTDRIVSTKGRRSESIFQFIRFREYWKANEDQAIL
ncbi:MAG: hypothetical protein PHX79_06055 [Sphaerochaetaceae bacterium]|jgi:hypothetical protein|nr:hypothetical protein [Sphaerochaetaceae bacterium]